MKQLAMTLALGALLASGMAGAQVYDDDRYGPAPYGDYSHRAAPVQDRGRTYRTPDRYADQGDYDWARVVRVDPVFDGRTRRVYDTRRCETRRDGYVSRDPYPRDAYGGYGDDRYGDPYGPARRDENGRLVATVIGGIAGAVLGSRIGDGSGQLVGTAVGSMVGGAAGRGIYEANRRNRQGSVTVCEPDPYRDGYGGYDGYDTYGDGRYDGPVSAYDVTYEYAGRQYVTRTDHHPGDRIRVRVDVRPE